MGIGFEEEGDGSEEGGSEKFVSWAGERRSVLTCEGAADAAAAAA
jgi:hypothetical protein